MIISRSYPRYFVTSLMLFAATALHANDDFFERKIRPVLVQHCYECHSEESDVIQGDFRVDHAATMVEGGDSGTAIVPGDPDSSLLLLAMKYDDLKMPPDGKLDDRIIENFERWILEGAKYPESEAPLGTKKSGPEIDWQNARNFWAFTLPKKSQEPETFDPSLLSRKHDAFVVAKLEQLGLSPNRRADRQSLIRRVTFDLTGLPPTWIEVQDFLDDTKPDSFRRVVDRLLASPQHAERWARLWLDVARYAEDQAHKVGNNDSLTYPNAFHYRDWVINAFAADVPYDQFIRLQLAADLIDPNDTDSHLALGFLGLGPKYYRRSSPEVQADEWEDRVDTVTRGLLGLTVACARCHDHKYDPIPTSDYYALAGVFASTEMFNRPLNDKVATKKGEAAKPHDAVHIVREGKPVDLHVMIRGDVSNRGTLAPRAFLSALSENEAPRLQDRSGRLDLANAISDQQNPLAARVIVNRVWRELMGAGIVETPSNFGALGERPSHLDLLDDLAVRFMENGWSLKWLQREIVLSSTYQQSSEVDSDKMAVDPANRLLWRIPRRRLSIESYRDAILSVARNLDVTVGGVSIQPDDPSARRRTLYSEVSRMALNPLLARFDFPDPNAHSAKRVDTTTPLQKLFMLNSPFLVRQSEELSKHFAEQPGSQRSVIEFAYRTLYGRIPTENEIAWGEDFIGEGDPESWSQYAQALLIANEMFTID